MEKLINKINIFNISSNKRDFSFEKKGIKPKKHWVIIIICSTIIVFILAIMSFYFYIKIDNGTLFNIKDEEFVNEIEINKVLLDKITKDFDYREQNLIEIRSGKVVPANPNL